VLSDPRLDKEQQTLIVSQSVNREAVMIRSVNSQSVMRVCVCVIKRATVWIVKSPSPAKSIVIELYGSDYMISNCDTAEGSTCEIVNCVIVKANVE
jgi:hypothetical protein